MLPSNLKLKIKTGTVGYNNKILISNSNFILGKNEIVNSLEPTEIKSHKDSKTNSLETPTSKNHKTNPLETPAMKSTQTAVNSKRTAEKRLSLMKMRKLLSSFFNWNIYHMVHFSMKVSHQLNKKVLTRRRFCMDHLLIITLTPCQLV